MKDIEYYGRIKWFGPTWHAPICEPKYEVPTPVDEDCLLCHEPVHEGQRGVMQIFSDEWGSNYKPVHLDCFFRSLGISSGPSRCPD